ncbi:sulfite exporter TauE/SafE family protein [Phaeobacter marinintestinus]|uniref:sulfite exporter TauE/SafE family protein n=1 Tax=Falsiphaeobacter marinintestinus TaxID=1492905 RepID=UPI0011B7B544|nr:sulfite exporter TauE/SafE family protein [Phaeobacter marinintestinus]
MDALFSLVTPFQLGLAFAIATLAGLVKGMVGFAMPMILISGLGTFLSPELALAGLILPTLLSNGLQAFRLGARQAVASVAKFRVFLGVGGACLLFSSQLVTTIPASFFLLMLGVMVTGFAVMQLIGIKFHLDQRSTRVEAGVGAFAGFIGGMSGVWGPPTVAYLTALNTPKVEQVQIQGVIYGLGALLLTFAHLGSGVLRLETLPLSLALIVPAMLGMRVGLVLLDRIDQVTFRRATLVVLIVAGLNLVRRGLTG